MKSNNNVDEGIVQNAHHSLYIICIATVFYEAKHRFTWFAFFNSNHSVSGKCVHTDKASNISKYNILSSNQQCHNMCSRCLPSANTHKRRRLRHLSTQPCQHCTYNIADRASVNRCFSSHKSFIDKLYQLDPVINWVQVCCQMHAI